MPGRVALVGHCGPDSSGLKSLITRAVKGVEIVAADDSDELDRVVRQGIDLLLFNRVLDYGFDTTEGVVVMREVHARHPEVKMMLVSNFPESQAAAVAAGALPGFGKREMGSPRVGEMIRQAMAPAAK